MIPVPEKVKETNEILSIQCLPLKSLKKPQLDDLGLDPHNSLENCEATVLENGKVLCYRCAPNHFYDAAAQLCRKTEEYSTMQGCAVTYDNVHCVFCQSAWQMDFTSGKCIGQDRLVKFKNVDSGMGPQYEQENKSIAEGRSEFGQKMFDDANGYSDEYISEMDGYDAGNGYGR